MESKYLISPRLHMTRCNADKLEDIVSQQPIFSTSHIVDSKRAQYPLGFSLGFIFY